MTPANPDVCLQPLREHDTSHSWSFDGDDPYIVCHGCEEVRDAVSGEVMKRGVAHVEETT